MELSADGLVRTGKFTITDSSVVAEDAHANVTNIRNATAAYVASLMPAGIDHTKLQAWRQQYIQKNEILLDIQDAVVTP